MSSEEIVYSEKKIQPIVITRNQYEFWQRAIPREKFVEYEPKDMEWMIPLGMAPLKAQTAVQRLCGMLIFGQQ
jgi:hypothetical protein